MKTTSKIILNKLPALKAGQMLVACKSVPNPDFGETERKAEPEYFVVDNFEQAVGACLAYIKFWELGGGNFPAAEIYTRDARASAWVSYNGRVWTGDDRKQEIKVNPISVEKFKGYYLNKYDDMLVSFMADNDMKVPGDDLLGDVRLGN